VLHFATFLMLMPLPQTVVAPSETLLCDREFRDERNKLVGLARLQFDKDHEVASSILMIWGSGFKAEWGAALKNGAVSLAPVSLDVDSWPLPKETRFPIQVDVAFDKKNIGRFQFPAATVQIVNLAQYLQARETSSAKLSSASSPAVELPKSLKLENLWGAASIIIQTSDASGAVVDRRTLKTPNWQAMRAFSDAAFVDLEARREHEGCRRVYNVTITD
jgi:hypothetical protein